MGSGDKKVNVLKNLKIVQKKVGCKKNNLIMLHQIHSSKFYYINKAPKRKLVGDGLITKKANIYFRLKRLIDKNQMGKLFKVIFLANNNSFFNRGFKTD